MGIALSMISGGDVALLYDAHLAAGGERSRGTAVLGNMQLAGQTGTAVSALLGGAIVTLSYGHLLWANAILSWIPMLLVLGVTEPPRALARGKKRFEGLKEVLSTTLVRDGARARGAAWLAHWTVNPEVAGSSPVEPAIKIATSEKGTVRAAPFACLERLTL